jgi:heat shock protein HtpX
MEVVKTVILMVALTLLMVFIGNIFGGTQGMVIALIIAIGMNFFSYFFSDKMVLRHYRAIPVTKNEASGLYAITERLCKKANLPMPKIYIIRDKTPNAFATGRNPSNAAVAVTEGLLELLDEDEVEGVLAHELSHVRHYDILIGTIAATIAGAIAIMANMMQFGAMFGSRNERGTNPIIMLVMALLLPIAASIIQMAISRNREYMADEGAARITGHPEWLQRALMKLDSYSKRSTMQAATPETAHMFIVNPFAGKKVDFASLFSTHPSTQDRIARLEKLKYT